MYVEVARLVKRLPTFLSYSIISTVMRKQFCRTVLTLHSTRKLMEQLMIVL